MMILPEINVMRKHDPTILRGKPSSSTKVYIDRYDKSIPNNAPGTKIPPGGRKG